VKQNFPTARRRSQRFGVGIAGLVAVVFLNSTCATLPHRAVEETDSHLQAATSETSARININCASAQELERLPAIGKVVAERIVEHRQAYGSFRRAEHIMMVRGISERKFLSLRSLITTE